ncbi:MAG: archaellin/type IV pilin N-terminal domain-containing protein, partial [Thermoprotei archaeon]
MKAISPVIATVIIVAVAIAISIAVALWITGLTSAFTGVEKLEIVNAYATKLDTGGWTVTIIIRNSGTKPATVDN